jgi:2-methylcitrate dehydratase PrpD
MNRERKQPRISKAFSEYVFNTSFEDLPSEVIHQTKRLILDTLGCTIGGYYSEGSGMIRRLARAWGGEPQSSIIGGGWKTSSVHAAWVNGYMGMALDGDDTFIAHPAVPVIHGIMPIAEYAGASGKDVITAVAIGYDVLARFGLSVEPEFRPTREGFSLKPVSGMGWKILGAVAGASKILRLSKEEMIHAFCMAVQFSRAPSAAKWSFPVDSLPLSKYYDAGGTAQSGMLAALLAGEGMTAPTGLLEGKYGFFKMQGFEECNVDFMLEGLGKKWWILETSFKPWPSCRLTHHALTAFEKIVKRESIKGEEIDRVVVKGGLTYNPIFHVKHPETPVNRQFSLNHCLANIAFGVPRGLLWHDAQNAGEHRIKEFREKVTFEPDPKTLKAVAEDFGGPPPHLLKRVPTTVEVTVQGKSFKEYTEYAKGDPWTSESTMTDDELMSKFRNFAQTLSASVKWREKSERAMALLLSLEELVKVSEVTELLSP